MEKIKVEGYAAVRGSDSRRWVDMDTFASSKEFATAKAENKDRDLRDRFGHKFDPVLEISFFRIKEA